MSGIPVESSSCEIPIVAACLDSRQFDRTIYFSFRVTAGAAPGRLRQTRPRLLSALADADFLGMHAERSKQLSTLAQRCVSLHGQLFCLRVLLPTPVSDCPVALALCSPSCSVPLSRGASALNRFICVTWRNLINCYLSLFPSLVIFCWRCKPPLTGGGMRDMHSRSVLPRFRHTRYRSRYRFRQHARAGFAGVSSTVGCS